MNRIVKALSHKSSQFLRARRLKQSVYHQLCPEYIKLQQEVDLAPIFDEIPPQFESGELSSIHYGLAYKIAQAGFEPSRILEIGTLKGLTSVFFRKVFPKAEIITIDLPPHHPASQNPNAISLQKTLLSEYDVNMILSSSIDQSVSDSKFDLIWIDGAHYNPFVAIDMYIGFNSLSKNGTILFDDCVLRDLHFWRPATDVGANLKNLGSWFPEIHLHMKSEESVSFLKYPRMVACCCRNQAFSRVLESSVRLINGNIICSHLNQNR